MNEAQKEWEQEKASNPEYFEAWKKAMKFYEKEEARACAECQASSVEWCNNGGDWFYRNEVLYALHAARVKDGNHVQVVA